jgi:L-aminopeptidase/D-esterase-like protein
MLRNLITDVPGLAVGSAGSRRLLSGVTVVLPHARAAAAVSVMGGAPGTRETDLLDPACTVDRVDAIVLSGGSAFGLDAASGVMDRLRAAGRGFAVRSAVVPIVPAAILFDLLNGGDKDWGEAPPYRRLGRAAFDRAMAEEGRDFALGNAGAGLGCTAGRLKVGLGSASARTADGLTVGALVAVNCFGSVLLPGSDAFWAAPFERDGEFGGVPWPSPVPEIPLEFVPEKQVVAANTTIAVVATDVALDKAALARVALMAQDGLARAIRPVHTPVDGDTVFALSTGRLPAAPDAVRRVGALAADCLARAVARGVHAAASIGPHRAWRDLYPPHAQRAALAAARPGRPKSRHKTTRQGTTT